MILTAFAAAIIQESQSSTASNYRFFSRETSKTSGFASPPKSTVPISIDGSHSRGGKGRGKGERGLLFPFTEILS